MSCISFFSQDLLFCLWDMNTKSTPARREEMEVGNKRIPLRNEQVPIVYEEDVNEAVPPTQPQGP